MLVLANITFPGSAVVSAGSRVASKELILMEPFYLHVNASSGSCSQLACHTFYRSRFRKVEQNSPCRAVNYIKVSKSVYPH